MKKIVITGGLGYIGSELCKIYSGEARFKKIVVTDICNEMNLDQSAVSQHLAVLRQSGVVQTERRGKYIFYFLNVEKLYHIQSLVQLEAIQNERLMEAFEPQGRKRQFFWQ